MPFNDEATQHVFVGVSESVYGANDTEKYGYCEFPDILVPGLGSSTAVEMAQYFPGLKSRNDAARLRAARDLQKYVSTELRELPDEQSSEILDDVNQNIFSLISSQEVHEKKGGILAIGE